MDSSILIDMQVEMRIRDSGAWPDLARQSRCIIQRLVERKDPMRLLQEWANIRYAS